ncbi:13401_t:CDS:2, partial [Funneliformis mosseae]
LVWARISGGPLSMPRCLRSHVFRTTEFEDDVEVEPGFTTNWNGNEWSAGEVNDV